MKIDVLYFEGCPNHPPAVELVESMVAELGITTSLNLCRSGTRPETQHVVTVLHEDG